MKLSINPKWLKREIKVDDLGNKYVSYIITLKAKVLMTHYDTDMPEEDVFRITDKSINPSMTKELIVIEDQVRETPDIFDFPNKMEELFRSGFGKGDL